MTPERWQQIEALYRKASECTPEARAALLAQADPQLRSEVEALLAQQESTVTKTIFAAPLTQIWTSICPGREDAMVRAIRCRRPTRSRGGSVHAD